MGSYIGHSVIGLLNNLKLYNSVVGVMDERWYKVESDRSEVM